MSRRESYLLAAVVLLVIGLGAAGTGYYFAAQGERLARQEADDEAAALACETTYQHELILAGNQRQVCLGRIGDATRSTHRSAGRRSAGVAVARRGNR